MKRIKPSNILLVLAVFISIGFAYLSTNLAINGTSLFKKSSWDVHFDNIEIDSGSVQLQTGDYAPTISNDGLTVSYKITCNIPGEYYKFNIDVVNDGSLNAKIDSINAPTIPQGYEDNILFSLKYLDGTDVKEGNVLLVGEKTTYVVTTKNRDDISADQLISEAITLPMEVSISYTQIKSSDITKATFKTGWEVSTLMNNLADRIDDQLYHVGYSNNIKHFKRSDTLDDDSNIISTEDSDKPIYIWYEESDENYPVAFYNELTEEFDYYVPYGIIYWYSDADVVYLNEDSSFFFNHDIVIHENYLDENNANTYTEEEIQKMLVFGNLTDISGIAQIITSKVTNMAYMFDRCCQMSDYSLLKTWDVTNVTDMEQMFNYNTSNDYLDYLSNWDVSNVTNMSHMFYYNINLNDLSSLEEWNTKKVTNMSYMFAYAKMINLNGLSSWNVTNVTDMSGMFSTCRKLADASAIENWDVSNVTDMSTMFSSNTTTLPSWYS